MEYHASCPDVPIPVIDVDTGIDASVVEPEALPLQNPSSNVPVDDQFPDAEYEWVSEPLPEDKRFSRLVRRRIPPVISMIAEHLAPDSNAISYAVDMVMQELVSTVVTLAATDAIGASPSTLIHLSVSNVPIMVESGSSMEHLHHMRQAWIDVAGTQVVPDAFHSDSVLLPTPWQQLVTNVVNSEPEPTDGPSAGDIVEIWHL